MEPTGDRRALAVRGPPAHHVRSNLGGGVLFGLPRVWVTSTELRIALAIFPASLYTFTTGDSHKIRSAVRVTIGNVRGGG